MRNTANQGDITPPTISGTGSVSWNMTGAFTYSLTVDENSYPVSAAPASQGMQVVVNGAEQCSFLVGTAVTWRQGIQDITLTPTMSGAYVDCTLQIIDHGSNASNSIELPDFVYGLGNTAVCYDPALTIDQDECLALATLYSNTDGTNWFTEVDADPSNDWLGSPDVSTWFGVTVS